MPYNVCFKVNPEFDQRITWMPAIDMMQVAVGQKSEGWTIIVSKGSAGSPWHRRR